MADRRGLAAALAGALRGAVGVQQDRQGRQRQLADQQSAQQQLIQRIMLQEKLRAAAQAAQATSGQQADIASEQREQARAFQEAIGRGRSAGLPGLGSDKMAQAMSPGDKQRFVGELLEALRQLDIKRAGQVKAGEERGKTERARLSADAIADRQRPRYTKVVTDEGKVVFTSPDTRETVDTGLTAPPPKEKADSFLTFSGFIRIVQQEMDRLTKEFERQNPGSGLMGSTPTNRLRAEALQNVISRIAPDFEFDPKMGDKDTYDALLMHVTGETPTTTNVLDELGLEAVG